MGLRVVCCVFLAFLVLAGGGLFSETQAARNQKYASIVIDADTGFVLHERYADKPLHPASLTKIMTLYMAFEALQQGRIRLNERVRISRHAASMVPSKLGLKPGSSIRVRDAIYALVTKSANDVAVALAEHIGGTESNFARMMTHRARDMGMNKTIFRNASGLHDPRQISTARDMSTLARITVKQYPDYYRVFSRRRFTYNGKTYRNHNRLMENYKGMDGIKTGYVNASGFNLVASAVRNERRLIGVVFGGRSSHTRNAHMASLLDRGFDRLNDIRMAHAATPLPPRKPGLLVAMNALGKAAGKAAQSSPFKQKTQRLAFLTPALEEGKFSELLGEGDYDPGAVSRIETGLMAIHAHRGSAAPDRATQMSNLKPEAGNQQTWAVQVGAFKSRAATDHVLTSALKSLPRAYHHAQPLIAPMKTRDGWLFRARLAGLDKRQAVSACRYLKECIPVPAH